MFWILFLKRLQTEDLQLCLKKSPTQVFSCEVCKTFKNTFSYRKPPVTASAVPVAASVFFLNSNLTAIAISQPFYDVLIIFSYQHIF